MAIAFVRNRPISKAKGESAGNLYAYINRVDDWKGKKNWEESVIPYNPKPPHGFDNMQQVFKDADTYERSNGITAKELTIAIPLEFNKDEARELMFKICQQYEPTRYLSAVTHFNDHNPHIHLMLLERQRDGVDRPKEQFFKRYNSSKDPAETGTPKFPNTAKDRRDFLDNARSIVETETNKILKRKELEPISFDAQDDDSILPPAPHLGAKLHKPMLKALTEKESNPDHDPIILKHPKVVRYLKRQEAQNNLKALKETEQLITTNKQELAKPIHQTQLKQVGNIDKIGKALAAQQAQKQAETERINKEFAIIQAEYKQRNEAAKELTIIQAQKQAQEQENKQQQAEEREAEINLHKQLEIDLKQELAALETEDKEAENLEAWKTRGIKTNAKADNKTIKNNDFKL